MYFPLLDTESNLTIDLFLSIENNFCAIYKNFVEDAMLDFSKAIDRILKDAPFIIFKFYKSTSFKFFLWKFLH